MSVQPADRPTAGAKGSAMNRWERLVRRDPEAGFTLIEVIVAGMLIIVVMAATTEFFLGSTRASRALATRQVAIQVADSAAEQIRAYRGTEIVGTTGQTLPTIPTATVNQIVYTTALSAAATTIASVTYYRVRIDVTWPDTKVCGSSGCTYTTYVLVNGDDDPQFNTG
jgi:Tfp pilus assembly protein PilV